MSNRRFIICTDSAAGGSAAASAADRDAITHHLRDKGWQVWHWLQDVWLVVCSEGAEPFTLRGLGHELRQVMASPDRHLLLLDVDGSMKYAGRAPTDGWPWMDENWAKSDASPATDKAEMANR